MQRRPGISLVKSARLDVLRNLLPQRPRKAVEHHAAMPWRDIPAFMAELKGKEPLSARALEWTILTPFGLVTL